MLDKDKKGYLDWENFTTIIPELLKSIKCEEVLGYDYDMGYGEQ